MLIRLYGEPQNYVFRLVGLFQQMSLFSFSIIFIDFFCLAILLPHFRLFDDTLVNCGVQIFTKSRPRVYE